jgi:ABC-type lipoprotein export system ATPase subunit
MSSRLTGDNRLSGKRWPLNQGVIVETRDLTKVYGDGAGVRALDGVNLTVQQGEFVAVMGPSGSGKSTLLNLVGAMDRPTSGEVYVAGERLAEIQDLDRFRGCTVGFVFQMHNLIPALTVRENVQVPMRVGSLSRRARRERADELLALVGLAERAGHRPPQLSGGERQRVAIARSLANGPLLVLADEPTGNLDSTSGADVMALFRRLNRERSVTVVVVTHDPAMARSADRVVVLQDGQIVRDEALESPYLADLREFKGSSLGQTLLKGRIPKEVDGLGLEGMLPELQKVLARA